MGKTMYEEFASTPEGRRLLNRETLTIEVTELICQIMQEKGISRKQLAELLGKSKGRVSQMLNGERNLTLGTVADIFTVLNERLAVRRQLDPLLHGQSGDFKTTRMQYWVARVKDQQVWKYEGSRGSSVGYGEVAS
ncbi:MAG TPA: helix-turn-helix transcriptional regulator [Thermoguttaceae bacterium]|nr:helix-turn-helix transcriptional regulator [Thermoguttaceae bacterium]